MTTTVEHPTGSRSLDPAACYRAVSGRDPRFDGRVFLGVVTTGVYCRPSCPARTPRPENCRYFATAAAAVAAGFRACRRCRPDALPGSREWDHRTDLAARAVRMIGDGVVDEVGVGGLAGRLHVSDRHLHRVLVAEVGASPQQLARTRRAQTARMLVEQTSLSMTEIAFAAGFASVRQFNDVMRAEFGVVPSALRRRPVPDGASGRVPSGLPTVTLRLRLRPPFARDPLARFLRAHAVPGLERVEPDGSHVRTVPAPGGAATVRVSLGQVPDDGDHLPVRMRLGDLADLAGVVARLRRWLDLDADPVQVDHALAADPALLALVAERPGLRVPGAVDGVETAVLAVLGQHVSLRAARTFAARLVEAYGDDAGDGARVFPRAETLAAADPDEVRAVTGVTGARARTVVALGQAVAAGALDLRPGADRAHVRRALMSLPGVGPWTTEYVALRSLADPDAYPAGDLVLRRALGVSSASEATARAERWRPWRGYALLHLWTKEALT
ncbi:MAG TPA: AlkA N-terminal domain-containing protein [Jiangellales bacterium]|nr:AlkA N-terminal domain-containing protein [Jiangellales bacterium]